MGRVLHLVGVASAAIAAAAPACASHAQSVEIEGEATAVVGGAVGGEAERKPVDMDIRLRADGSYLMDNGIELGAGLEARLDADSPAAWWSGGRYSTPNIGGAGALIGEDSDVALQSAFAYARGGFGQLVVGRDRGVGRRLAVTSPTIFTAIGVNDWRTDLTGLNDVHTVNDFSGYATKVSFLPPGNFLGGVLGGLQFGVSYSPRAADCSEDVCASGDGLVFLTPGVVEAPSWKDILETAVYYENDVPIGSERLVFGLGASYVTANEESDAPGGAVDEYESYALGLNLGYGGLTLGGSVKNSNVGVRDEGEGYLAFDAGVTYETGSWGFMLGYGESDSDIPRAFEPGAPLLRRDTSLAQAGVTYLIGPGVTVGAAAQYVDSRRPLELGADEETTAVVFESSIRF